MVVALLDFDQKDSENNFRCPDNILVPASSLYRRLSALAVFELQPIYYCPLKSNRLVDDTGGVEKYKKVQELNWNEAEKSSGKTIKIKGFPRDKKVKIFWQFGSLIQNKKGDLKGHYICKVILIGLI